MESDRERYTISCVDASFRRWALTATLAVAGCGSPDRDNPFRTSAVDAGARDAGGAVDTGVTVGGACRDDRDCDDRMDCTEDTCVVGGLCEHLAVNSRCPAGQTCFPSQGCATMATRRCAMDAECDDGVPCTRDVCVAGNMCSSIRDDARCGAGQVCGAMGCIAMGRCTGDGECSNGVWCDGDERCVSGVCQPGTRRTCGDNDPCTGDICNEAMDRCENPALNPCGGAVQSGTYQVTPPLQYSCGAGSLGPVSTLTLTASTSGVEVTGLGTTLRGAAPSMGMFTVSGSESRGGCQWQYTLTGAFTMPTQFAGSLSITFNFCEASLRCTSRSFPITGVRQ